MFRSAHDAFAPAVTAAQTGEVDRVAGGDGPNLYQTVEHAGHSLVLTALEMATVATPS